jgi:tetratricopeptide (TPR) repeat protein
MSCTDFPNQEEAKKLAQQGRIHEALDCYDGALRTHPDNDTLLNSKAIALISLGRYEEALGVCRRAASINPNSADIWTNMGVILEKLNRLPEAADALERAISINPYDCYARALLGIAYQKLNMEDRAEAQNRELKDLMFPNEYAGFFFGTAAFLLGLLLGGIRGVEGRLFVISISSQVIILFFFCIICILYWKSLIKLNEINRNVIIVPYPSPVQGDRSSRGMYIVLAIMIIVFTVGILAGSDVWNWMR